ncbi:hypothetical protein M8Q70_002919 [Salmonella enterica]|nr:hypothetical protein [Salmonella enterica]EIV7025259.1 hypothetical protein [Salmonella enterica]EIW3702018.1 hypothetical protein [Salmonella enterica]EJF4885522.1 hypothetical protein [Salmonella enterica]ELX2875570.1 hypothetical protein [Salmonella enterica]
MRNFKEIRETMTEEALSIESVMRGHQRIQLNELAEACFIKPETVEFILTQMECAGMVHRVAFNRYSLTPEYKKAWM